MGLFGFGRKTTDSQGALASTKSALEQAKDPQSQGVVSGSVTRLVENLLDIGIDGKGPFDSASEVAERALKDNGGDVERAVDAIASSHLKLSAAGGFVTNLGGFITLPVALPANVLGFYVIATRMAAAIAQLRGYDLKQQQIRTAVLLSLVGADSNDLLAKAGMVTPTGRLTNLAAQRLPGPALMVLNKAIGFRILSTAGKKTLSRLGRGIPVVGGVVGAGMDGFLIRKLADHARKEFPANGAVA